MRREKRGERREERGVIKNVILSNVILSFVHSGHPGSRCSPSLGFGARCSLGPAGWRVAPRAICRSKWCACYECALSTFIFAPQNRYAYTALVRLGLGLPLVALPLLASPPTSSKTGQVIGKLVGPLARTPTAAMCVLVLNTFLYRKTASLIQR